MFKFEDLEHIIHFWIFFASIGNNPPYFLALEMIQKTEVSFIQRKITFNRKVKFFNLSFICENVTMMDSIERIVSCDLEFGWFIK